VDIENIIASSVDLIDEVVDREYPEQLAECAAVVFESMGQEPTNRGWSYNSLNTKKKVGVMGRSHRNVDTGFLAKYASTPGNILDDNWLNKIPDSENYKDANALGRFDDIGRTAEDEDWIAERLAEKIAERLK
jgi:hypothetical protein